MKSSLFSNLKIIDLSTVLAGPSVATFFAELGAEVIKIENKRLGDVTRTWKLPSEEKDSPISAYFSAVNYKKEYINLDISDNADNAKLIEMTNSSDIVIMNFKKGDERKLNITEKILRKNNSRLIIGKISGFGNDSDRVAYDLILQAETGFMSMNGTEESGPVKMPVAFIDVLAAHHLKEGLLIALLEREKTQIGSTVSVSLYDAAISSLMNQASNYLMENKIPKRLGSCHPNIAPYGEIFTTSEGHLITFAIGSESHFEKLCGFLSCGNLPDEKDFSTNQNRVENRKKLAEIIQEKVKCFTSTNLLNAMHNLHIPCAKIKNLKEVFEDENAKKLVRSEQIVDKETKRVTSIAFEWE